MTSGTPPGHSLGHHQRHKEQATRRQTPPTGNRSRRSSRTRNRKQASTLQDHHAQLRSTTRHPITRARNNRFFQPCIDWIVSVWCDLVCNYVLSKLCSTIDQWICFNFDAWPTMIKMVRWRFRSHQKIQLRRQSTDIISIIIFEKSNIIFTKLSKILDNRCAFQHCAMSMHPSRSNVLTEII